MLPMMMMMSPQGSGSNPMLPMILGMMGKFFKLSFTLKNKLVQTLGGGNEDILPLLMNMPRPPMVDPMTGLTMPQEQDPNQMMMMMALMGDKNNAMIPSR